LLCVSNSLHLWALFSCGVLLSLRVTNVWHCRESCFCFFLLFRELFYGRNGACDTTGLTESNEDVVPTAWPPIQDSCSRLLFVQTREIFTRSRHGRHIVRTEPSYVLADDVPVDEPSSLADILRSRRRIDTEHTNIERENHEFSDEKQTTRRAITDARMKEKQATNQLVSSIYV
jgi:hypothetical protein